MYGRPPLFYSVFRSVCLLVKGRKPLASLCAADRWRTMSVFVPVFCGSVTVSWSRSCWRMYDMTIEEKEQRGCWMSTNLVGRILLRGVVKLSESVFGIRQCGIHDVSNRLWTEQQTDYDRRLFDSSCDDLLACRYSFDCTVPVERTDCRSALLLCWVLNI
jgi:hypothetical protein